MLFFKYRWSQWSPGTVFPGGIPKSDDFYSVNSWYRLKQEEAKSEPETDNPRHKLVPPVLPGTRANLYHYYTKNFGAKDTLKITFILTLSLATKIWILIGAILGLVAGGLLLVDLIHPLISHCLNVLVFKDATQVLTVSGGAVATLIAIRSWFLAAAFETAEQVRVSRIYFLTAASISTLAIFLLLYRITLAAALIFAGLICVMLVVVVLIACLRKEYITHFPRVE